MQTLLLAFLVAAAMVVFISAQVICCRGLPRASLLISVMFGFILGLASLFSGLSVILDAPARNGGFWWTSAAVFMIYQSLSIVFVCFIAAGETSVRIQILRVLSSRREGCTPAELDRVYSNRSLVRIRIDRLLEAQAISEIGYKYKLTSLPLLIIARSFLVWKIVIYGVTNEFGLASNRPVLRD